MKLTKLTLEILEDIRRGGEQGRPYLRYAFVGGTAPRKTRALRRAGYIEDAGSSLRITEAGRAILVAHPTKLPGDYLIPLATGALVTTDWGDGMEP